MQTNEQSHKCLSVFDPTSQWSQLNFFFLILKNLFKIRAIFWITNIIHLQLYISEKTFFFFSWKWKEKSQEGYVWKRSLYIYFSHIYRYICIVGEEVVFWIKRYLKTDKIKNGRMEVTSLHFQWHRALIFYLVIFFSLLYSELGL